MHEILVDTPDKIEARVESEINDDEDEEFNELDHDHSEEEVQQLAQ